MIKIGILAMKKRGANPNLVPYVNKVDNVSYTDFGNGHGSHETIVAEIIKNVLDKYKVKYEIREYENTYSGIYRAYKDGCSVVNVSYSMVDNAPNSSLKELCDKIVVVTSAGNRGGKKETELATYDNVISVGAVDKNKNHMEFSSFGSGDVDIACLGEHHLFGETHKGTSYASPVATAIIALLLNARPDYKFDDVMKYLEYFSIDVEDEGRDLKTGFGYIDKYYPYDIQGHWGKDTLVDYVKREILLGFSDGTLRPDENLTRAESIVIQSRIEKQMESKIEEIVRKVLKEGK